MSKECQICNTTIESSSQYCSNCGWELVVISENSSEQLQRIINEKKLRYKQNYDRFKNSQMEIKTLHEEIKVQRDEIRKLKEELTNSEKDKPSFIPPSSLSVGRRLCILTENHQIVMLNAGENTFGRLGPATETHYVFNDGEMDGKHFALQIDYNLPDGSLYSCKIKSIGQKDTFVNITKKIGNNWEAIDANDEIKAGKTKIILILTK